MGDLIQLTEKTKNEIKRRYAYKCIGVPYRDADGNRKKYPCIVLYELESGIPIKLPGLELYIYNPIKEGAKEWATLEKRGVAVCHFLNYVLHETEISSINECSINDIRNALKSISVKADGTYYHEDTLVRYKEAILNFLIDVYRVFCNNSSITFNYCDTDLTIEMRKKSKYRQTNEKSEKKAGLGAKIKTDKHRKNRAIPDEHKELLVELADIHVPDISLAIKLQLYAGLRAGEIVNISYDRIEVMKDRGIVQGLLINLEEDAAFWDNKDCKTNPGRIKNYRTQKVLDEYTDEVEQALEKHRGRMEVKGRETLGSAPVFLDNWGRPMTVKTYSRKVKDFFYDYFIPALERHYDMQGSEAGGYARLEEYRKEYPGTHMFRHWFTMHLVEAGLTREQEKTWRGDHSVESCENYFL